MVVRRGIGRRILNTLGLVAVLGIVVVLAVPFYEHYRERGAVDDLLARYEVLLARYREATRNGPAASCDALQAVLEAGESGDWGMLDIGFQWLPGEQSDTYRPVLTLCAVAPFEVGVARLARTRFRPPAVVDERAFLFDSVTSYSVALSPTGQVGCIGRPSLPPRPCAGVPPLPGRSAASRKLLTPDP